MGVLTIIALVGLIALMGAGVWVEHYCYWKKKPDPRGFDVLPVDAPPADPRPRSAESDDARPGP